VSLESCCVAPDAPAPYPEPFDHPDLYEVKFDGFRALAHVTAFDCKSFVCTARRSTRPRMMQ
jgi:hypothetical protein